MQLKITYSVLILFFISVLPALTSDFCDGLISETEIERLLFESLDLATEGETSSKCKRIFSKDDSGTKLIIELEQYNQSSLASAKLSTDKNIESKVEAINLGDNKALFYTNFNESEITIEVLKNDFIVKVTSFFEDVDNKEDWIPENREELENFTSKLIENI